MTVASSDIQAGGVRIITGDCREMLAPLPSDSVNCCVTSPPYFGLRDYNVDGQLGLEPTPEVYVAEMVAVFREVRRVLRDDGTLWLNIGDSYSGSGRGAWNVPDEVKTASGIKETYRPNFAAHRVTSDKNNAVTKGAGEDRLFGCKAKDLIGIPWMLAFALRADGWYLRQDIIWSKPNPMPESVKDRCTKSQHLATTMRHIGGIVEKCGRPRDGSAWDKLPQGLSYAEAVAAERRRA